MYGTRFDYLRLPPFIGEQMRLDDSQILVGQGSQAIRKIFKNQYYNTYEQQQLNSLKNRLNSLQEYNPQLHTDDILLRFLYANQFNINKANEQFIFFLDWITKPGIIDLTEEVETFYRKGAAYIGGRTKDNKPSIVIHTKLVDNLKILDKALAILCAIIEDYMFYSGKKHQIRVFSKFQQIPYAIQLEHSRTYSQIHVILFTSLTHHCLQISNGRNLRVQFINIIDYIAPNTLNKIKFLKKNEIPILSNQFPPDQLEKGLGGDRFMQSYWPPDPNYFMQSIPIQFEQPQQVQQEEVIFEPHYEIPQYVQPPQQQPPVEQPPQKKKCICVKCSKDLEEANAQPKDPKAKEAKPKPPQATPQQQSQPPAKNDEEPYKPIDRSKPNMDDTYLSYQRKYDSLVDDSSMLIPRYTEQPSIQPDEETKAYPEKEFGGSSFKKDLQPDKKQKPSFGNPYFNESRKNSVASSQQLYPKQQPRTQTYATQTNQPYDEDENQYIQIPQKQQQRQNDQYQTPQLQHGSQQSIQVQRQPQQQQYVQSPPPQQYQQQYLQQQPQQYQQPIQPQYQYTQPPPQQQQYVQPQYEQSQVYPQAQSHYPQAIPSYYPDYQVVQASVQDFEQTQYQTNKLPKNYDLSQFEKYNISDNKIFTPYDQQIDKQAYQTSWKPNFKEQSYVPGQSIYPDQPYSTYKPMESNSAYTPNQYTPYDYNIDNYKPTYAQTDEANKPNQLYSQKPGQQACSIQ